MPAAALIPAGLQIASGLFGGMMGAGAADQAAQQAAAAQQKALEFQQGVYSNARQDLSPYVASGQRNLGEYESRLANQAQPGFDYQQQDFNFNKYSDPGAQYMAQQAARAQEASAMARGATGGGFAKSLAENQSKLADTAYSSAYDRWLNSSKLKYGQAADKYSRDYGFQQGALDRYGNLASQGLQAGQALMGGGNTAAGNVGQLASGIGASQAAGTLGANNAWLGGINTAAKGLSGGLGQYFGQPSREVNDWGNT
jgi:hypothetical protein